MKDKASEIGDKTRKEIIETIKILESSADGSVKWRALFDLARYIDGCAEVSPIPPDNFSIDTEEGRWILDYLRGAAKYGALQYPDVRRVILFEIMFYMEDCANG